MKRNVDSEISSESRSIVRRRLAITALAIALAGGGTFALVAGAHAAGYGNPGGNAGNGSMHGGQGGPGGRGGNMQGGPGDGQDGPPSPEKMQERMKQELGLTDAQAAQVKQILESARAKHRAIHEETKEALSKILNAEQLQKLESHMRRGPGGGGPGGRGGNMGGGRGPGGGGSGGPGGGGGPGEQVPDDDNPPE